MDSPDSTFEQIESFIARGAEFLGNHWVNDPEKGGIYEVRLRFNGEVIPIKSYRPFPYVLWPASETK